MSEQQFKGQKPLVISGTSGIDFLNDLSLVIN